MGSTHLCFKLAPTKTLKFQPERNGPKLKQNEKVKKLKRNENARKLERDGIQTNQTLNPMSPKPYNPINPKLQTTPIERIYKFNEHLVRYEELILDWSRRVHGDKSLDLCFGPLATKKPAVTKQVFLRALPLCERFITSGADQAVVNSTLLEGALNLIFSRDETKRGKLPQSSAANAITNHVHRAAY